MALSLEEITAKLEEFEARISEMEEDKATEGDLNDLKEALYLTFPDNLSRFKGVFNNITDKS